ncbi:Polyadenylate-binding protein 7 [Striga hermonthica]|uniref:Polyadenylate-binding protein n=1 Tax=Striga hermonthica TaxID=68872 RepID=A0A9N7RSL9_STRHE|nr:Polyadenylate-binding protein 7 [Striga hermonthica]
MAAAAAPAASLYVGDLKADVTDGDLFDLFSEFNVASVRVCRDSSTGRSLCYGYVNFLSHQDAIRAIEEKNHSSLKGRAIRVTWSHRDPDARRSGVGNVFIKNLSESIDCIKLQEMFQKFGNILSCKVVTSDDGKSKGYGFVQFESENSAKAAIEELNGSTNEGKQMFVAKFMKKSDRANLSYEEKYTNLYVKNLDASFSEEDLREKFSKYGKVVSLVISKDENGASRGFGFVNFENPGDAKRAVEAFHGSKLGSKVLYVARAQKKSEREEILRRKFEEKRKEWLLKYQASNVYVKNIDDDVTDDELKQHFSKCGTITSEKIMRDDKGVSKGFGFVCFSTPEEANKAVYTLHGLVLRKKPLYVAIAQRKEDRQAQLQLMHMQRMVGLGGPSTIFPGGYSHFYYPASSVVPQFPAQSAVVYQPRGIRPGWRANAVSNTSGPGVRPSPGALAPNNPRPHRQNRGRLNGHDFQQGSALPHASHLQQANDSRNHKPIVFGAGLSAGGSQVLSTLLDSASPEQQKHILGEHLYPLVAHHQPDLAAKITGMILEMDNSELLLLLDSPKALEAKVQEGVEVLKISKSKVSTKHDSLRSKGREDVFRPARGRRLQGKPRHPPWPERGRRGENCRLPSPTLGQQVGRTRHQLLWPWSEHARTCAADEKRGA